MIAVERNPKSSLYIGKNLKDDDDLFKLAFQQDKELLRYASERFRKSYHTHSENSRKHIGNTISSKFSRK